MRKYIERMVIVMGLIAMIMGLFSGCSGTKPSETTSKTNTLPENVVDRLWVSADGWYQMKVEEDEVIFYTDGYDRALISKFSTKLSEEDTDTHAEFKLEDNRLKKKDDGVFASIEKLDFKDGAFSAKIVYSEGNEEWVTLNETYRTVFHSYEGGGPEYFVKISNEDVLQYYSRTLYSNTHGERGTGSGFDVIFYFGGRNPGTADVYIISNSLGEGHIKDAFSLVIDENYHITKSMEGLANPDVVGEDRL